MNAIEMKQDQAKALKIDEARIERMFGELQHLTALEKKACISTLYFDGDSRRIDVLQKDITDVIKRIVRAMFYIGATEDIKGCIQIGMLPPYAIQAALNRSI